MKTNMGRSNTAAAVREAANGVCQKCKRHVDQLQAHHIIHRSNGGPTTKENLIALCVDCHRKEHAIQPRAGMPRRGKRGLRTYLKWSQGKQAWIHC